MIIRTLDDVTADALAAMESTEDQRLRDIMASLVRHLHAFVHDVRLTEPEFRQAASILNELC
jgi:catechol 1,2-dioxygenase